MTEGKRPGGLTALAVFNFIGTGFLVLGAFAMLGLPALMDAVAQSGDAKAVQARDKMHAALAEIGPVVWNSLIALNFLSAILLLVSGIGYLKQRRTMGRTIGSVWAMLSLVTSIAGVVLTASMPDGGFSIMTIVALVYPVLTLILLNGTFKEDFTR